MDTFTLTIALILVILALQFNQHWIIFGTMILMILWLRSWSSTFVLLVALVLIFVFRGSMQSLFPIIVFGVIILALILGMKPQPQQPEYYAPELEGLMGR